jgi:hypothetical protein
VRRRLVALLVRLPGLRGLYLRALVRTLDRTPASKLPAELQQLKRMLAQVPPEQRRELLGNAAKGRLPQPEQMSRSMRRAAAREARRRR